MDNFNFVRIAGDGGRNASIVASAAADGIAVVPSNLDADQFGPAVRGHFDQESARQRRSGSNP
jgi:hypothetical protein